MNSFTLEAVDMKAVGQHWGWFLAKGILMILVGILALGDYVMVALFSMIFLGWLMIFAGVVEAIHAFWKKEWGGLFLNLLVGVLYVVVGYDGVGQPAGHRHDPHPRHGDLFHSGRYFSHHYCRDRSPSPVGLDAL